MVSSMSPRLAAAWFRVETWAQSTVHPLLHMQREMRVRYLDDSIDRQQCMMTIDIL